MPPNSAVIINLRALPHFPACLFNWIQEVLWKNSRNVESVICYVVWCCWPPTFKKKNFSSMAFAMDISMGFTMHIILTFGSMGFAMLTSMGFAMPSWHSWCTMYTEHFSSLDLSTVSKWLHHCCSHPPPLLHPPVLHFVLSPPYNLQFAQISASHTKFCWPRSKIKGTILAIGHWPEMAKIRDEPRKIIPTSERENILQDKYLLYLCKLFVIIYFKWIW